MQSQERSIGDIIRASLTVVMGLVILGLFIVALGGFRFWETVTPYTVLFDTVKDLGTGQPVKLDGMHVGRVTNIAPYDQDPTQVEVTIGIREDVTLYANSIASISQKGLVGDYYVLLTLEGYAGEPLEPNAVIPSRSVPGLTEIGAVVGDLVTALKPRLERIAEGLEQVFTPENTEHIANVLAELEVLVVEAQSAVQTLDTELDGVGGEAKVALRQGTAAFKQGEQTLVAVQQDFSTLSTELRTQVKDVGERLTALSAQVETDLGYNQEQLSQVLDQVQLLSEELTLLTQDLKERPWQVIRAPKAFPESTK